MALPVLDLRTLPESELSLAERVSLMPADEREEFLRGLGKNLDNLQYDWDFWARPEQQIEFDESWSITVLRAGRSAGKTRPAAEAVRKFVREHPRNYLGRPTRLAFIAPTPGDARDYMIGGTDGVQTISPPSEQPEYVVSTKRVTWPSGAYATVYSGAEKEDTRGATVELAWVDEPIKFAYPDESWSNLRLAMRGGRHPYTIVSSTPKPSKLIRDLYNRVYPGTVVRHYTTYRNLANIPTEFIEEVLVTLHGTRLGRQELMAELLEDVEGTLWNLDDIDASRVSEHPPLIRFGVACDPSGSTHGDEAGIIAGGLGTDGHVYITDDLSGQMGSDKWAQILVDVYRAKHADWILGEQNFGGDMIPSLVHLIDPLANYVPTHSSRGKQARAEPVAAFYRPTQFRPALIHHVGNLYGLENEQTSWIPPGAPQASKFSPGRIDALTFLVHKLLIDGGIGSVGFHDPSDDLAPTEDLFALPHADGLIF